MNVSNFHAFSTLTLLLMTCVGRSCLPMAEKAAQITLEQVRESLIRQEDTIIFGLIERAKYPRNAPIYDKNLNLIKGFHGSLGEFVVKETEVIQSKAGKYANPEENPFFPLNLSSYSIPKTHFPSILHEEAAHININKEIWDLYVNVLLPLFVGEGDDGNYASTAQSDLNLLQALSRRIHYGKFVAEVKFRESAAKYEAAIRAEDSSGLMKMLTFVTVEEQVIKRVEKKATIFGQDVTLEGNVGKYKVDPSFAGRLYEDWVIPLTKEVEVKYLLRRLN